MVTKKTLYIPNRGDIVYLNFDPTLGHEQKGRRPAFVISHKIYNEKSSLALFVPITKHQKNYPFEVLLPPELKTYGVILADQIKSLDWTVGNLEFVEAVSEEVIEEVLSVIELLIS